MVNLTEFEAKTYQSELDRITNMANALIKTDWVYKGRTFNLTNLGWNFKFNDKKQAVGFCSPKVRTIYLSKWFVENANRNFEMWVNTMVHEIAHAINYHLGGRGHDNQWKHIFFSLGGNGQRCASDITYNDILEKPVSKYTVTCPNGHTRPAHRFSRNIENGRVSCGKCSDKFDERFLLKQIQNY